MSDSATATPEPAKSRTRHFADILNPLFWHDDFYKMDRMFEWACTLVRAAGVKDTGWDSYTESLALLTDLTHLMHIDLPNDKFPQPADTKARLALISYSHVLEMDFPYELLANLLRLRLNLKYAMTPFSHLNRPVYKKINGVRAIVRIAPASPEKKIKEIIELSAKAGVPEVGTALKGIYNPTLRNAVYHSDYAIHDNSMHLLSGNYLSNKNGILTPQITFDELAETTNDAFAFHSALLALWRRARNSFTDFRGKFLPYDRHYKGVLEFMFEGDTLTGFRVYWPNGTLSTCTRSENGQSWAQNIHFNPDGSINFFVGLFASHPGSFSPCVEHDADPVYALVPGTDKRPYWPSVLEGYEL
jgi:hypothetical protein